MPWRKEWQPTAVLLPGEFHGQRSLEGYSPWVCKQWDMTERLTHTHIETHMVEVGSWGLASARIGAPFPRFSAAFRRSWIASWAPEPRAPESLTRTVLGFLCSTPPSRRCCACGRSCPWPCLTAPLGLAGDSGGLGMNSHGPSGASAGL